MSGDVQPRKRKDKKRRKDDSVEEKISHSQHYVPLTTNVDDINIHVHHEGGTGGGICAKIIFFILFSALAVLVGLIIVEHRGLTELDTVNTESRFSQIFEGWVDNSHGHEDDHSNEILDAIEEHDDEHEHEEENEHAEEDDHDEHDDEHDEHDDEHEDEHEEEEEEEEEEPEVIASDEAQDQDEEDEQDQTEEVEANTQEDEEEEATEEAPESEEQEEVEDELDDEEDNQSKAVSEEEEVEDEPAASTEQNDEEDENEEEAVDEADATSGEIKHDSEERETEDEQNEEEETDQENPENPNMAVKLGVGVALLIVAYVVLIRKWKSATNESTSNTEQPTDLTRRNTIVVPPSLQEIEQDMEEYSEGDDEVESDTENFEPPSVKSKYEELRTTYVRSLTPEIERRDKEQKDEEAEDEESVEEEEIEEEEVEEEDEEDEEVDEEEEDYAESDNEEYDEDDDLLKRLEAKYGKIQDEEDDANLSSWKRVDVSPHDNESVESESDKQSDDDGYEHADITSKDDYEIKAQIDEAHKSVEQNSALAIKQFNALLEKYPSSPRSLYGKALALDNLADQRRSNEILKKALKVYLQLLQLDSKLVPNELFIKAAEKCINRMRFLGLYSNAEYVHKLLIDRFPEEPKYANDLAVSYLTINRVEKARQVLKSTLSRWPSNGFARVHYGFILKTVDNNLKESVIYMKTGMATNEPGVHDGRFYFHLGDALTRLGQYEEASKVYEKGVENNVFLSKYQRSLYNINRLIGKPWWSEEELPYKNLFRVLKNNFNLIREEGLSVLNQKGYFQDEAENLRDTGDWKQFELFARGQRNVENCKKTPITCKLLQSHPEASGCKRGQTKFSVMHPGTHVWPHCGPTNCRLRVHLGLKVPPNTYIRVANETRSWEEGKIFIFDDSFEHEVWHNSTTVRLVLIIDVWHPELSDEEKRSLSPI